MSPAPRVSLIVPKASTRGLRHGLIAKETAFEVLPLQVVADITPIAPETNVVLSSGGLNTETSTVPGSWMSVAVMLATSWWLLTNVVTTEKPFQLTTESWRKLLPLTVIRNWLPAAVALLGVIEVMNGAGLQVPQDTSIASVIASTVMRINLGALAIGSYLQQLADDIERHGGKSGWSAD